MSDHVRCGGSPGKPGRLIRRLAKLPGAVEGFPVEYTCKGCADCAPERVPPREPPIVDPITVTVCVRCGALVEEVESDYVGKTDWTHPVNGCLALVESSPPQFEVAKVMMVDERLVP